MQIQRKLFQVFILFYEYKNIPERLIYLFLAQGLLPVSNAPRTNFQSPTSSPSATQWQSSSRGSSVPPQNPVVDVAPRVPTFNANLLPAPPLPPEHIVTEQDKQVQIVYEQWLNHQNAALTQQLKYYETEVQKLRKLRKVFLLLKSVKRFN